MAIRFSLLFPILFALIILSISDAESKEDSAIGNSTIYTSLYNDLMNMSPDSSVVAVVNNLTIKRDVGEFILQEGTISFCNPINGRICAAVFDGSGIFAFTPPLEIERLQLKRFYETDSLYRKFTHLFIMFGDETEFELRKNLPFSSGSISKKTKSTITNSLKFMGNKKTKSFNYEIVKTFLDNQKNKLFYAHIQCDKDKPLFFGINPYKSTNEKVYLKKEAHVKFRDWREVVCQFPAQNYKTNLNGSNSNKSYYINKYVMDCTFENNLDFSAKATIHLRSGLENQHWLFLNLYSDLEVDSVFWHDYSPLEYFRGKESSRLWVYFPDALGMDICDSITLFYHGRPVDRTTNWFYIESSTAWYPRNTSSRQLSNFDLTFHVPDKYVFVSVGDKIEEEKNGKIISTRWVSPGPVRNSSFNIGFFEEYEVEDDRVPPVTVLISEMSKRPGTHTGKAMEKQVGDDVANSIAFFQYLFDDCPFERFYATEISYSHGEAFPGLIHLDKGTFQHINYEGYNQMFRAHEVAHQWWGVSVDFKTYHDFWMAEAISEYCGLWYLQWVKKDNNKFFARLKDYHWHIMDEYNRKYYSDKYAGPIYLGYRTSSSDRPDGYGTIVYLKGAYVIHMLRNMLVDLKTMNEDRFLGLMRQFYNDFKGKAATTQDFQNLVSQYAGEDMAWFFDQWIYGVDIPTYKFSYKTEENDDGKFIVTCRVKQLNVPDEFKMYVPILIDFGNDQKARVRYLIEGPLTEFQLPLLPLQPKKIIFNDLESVLCEVKTEKWKDK